MTKTPLGTVRSARLSGRSLFARWVIGVGLTTAGLVGLDALVAYAYRPPRAWVEWSGWVSYLGSGVTALGVSGLVLVLGWLRRDGRLRRCGAALLIGVVAAGSLSFVLKSLIGRLRPYAMDGPWEFLVFHPLTIVGAWQSFPSGHATVMGVFIETLRRLYPSDRRLRWSMGAIAVAVCLARVTGRFHHPSDVVAGFLLGAWVGRRVTDGLNRLSRSGEVTKGWGDGVMK